MAKRSRKKRAEPGEAAPGGARAGWWGRAWVPLLLALAAFLVYVPSLGSGLVYDAPLEIVREGFVTSLANLPAVLSLKVLGMPLILGPRPGSLLYLMLIAAVSGKDPLGYHIGSNLLHAANVALLFILLRRLIGREGGPLSDAAKWRMQFGAGVVTLIFAVHPLSVEPVAGVSYCSDLLVVFFTLLGLLAGTSFAPRPFRRALVFGAAGTFCSFAAVDCKESGVSAAALLIVYWFFFRRQERKEPWLWFLAAALAVTGAFLAARFAGSEHLPTPDPLAYLGGSASQVFWIQPRLWVFMMGKLFWPVSLSGDYTLDDVKGLSFRPALAILLVVVALQIWLARKSRLGALGVATYWIGLATVSNFLPLYCIEADRYYYLPMAGVAMQFLALLQFVAGSERFWFGLAPLGLALVPLTVATLNREPVFTSDITLWTDTLRVNPLGQRAYRNLADAYYHLGRLDEAIADNEKALALNPDYIDAHFNLALALYDKGDHDGAIAHFRRVLALNPNFGPAHMLLGAILMEAGRKAEAVTEFEAELRLNPGDEKVRLMLEEAQAGMGGR